jgi:hypothetical protein
MFRSLFQHIARLIEVAHFDIRDNTFRIRGIDPHDLCYIDIFLYPKFFDEYLVDKAWRFSIDCSKLANVFKVLNSSQITLDIEDGRMEISAGEKWASKFIIKWLRTDIFDFPEPNSFDYEAILELSTKDLADIIRKASTVSHEIIFYAKEPNELTITAVEENYAFITKPLVLPLKMNIKGHVKGSFLLNYLKSLRYFIEKCETAIIFVGNNKPLRIDLRYRDRGIFSLSFSYKRNETVQKERREYKSETSFPCISMNSFILYLFQLSKYPEGVNSELLETMGLETKGHDNWRFADILALAYKDKGKIKLTPLGEAFLSLYEKDEEKAKLFLHEIIKETIVPYKVIAEEIEKPLALENLFLQINTYLREKKCPPISEQDMNTLLEIAKWCKVLKVKSGLMG